MSAVCPSCGVAVVSGYVRCPRCGATLPQALRATKGVSGGTAVANPGGLPVIWIAAGGAVVLAIIIVVALRRGGDDPPAAPPAEPISETTRGAEAIEPPPRSNEPAVASPSTTPTSPDPTAAADQLDRALKRQRLWGTVTIVQGRVDIRSGACGDEAMAPVLDAASPQLRAAGLTQLRCLEQSGVVAFERDL